MLWVQVWDLSQRSCLAQAHVDVSPGDTLSELAIDHTVRAPSHSYALDSLLRVRSDFSVGSHESHALTVRVSVWPQGETWCVCSSGGRVTLFHCHHEERPIATPRSAGSALPPIEGARGHNPEVMTHEAVHLVEAFTITLPRAVRAEGRGGMGEGYMQARVSTCGIEDPSVSRGEVHSRKCY